MLERLRIGPKLLLAPGLVLLLLMFSSGSAWHAMVRQNQAVDIIVGERAARIRDANELVAEAQYAHARMYQLLTWISASFSAPRIEGLGQDIYQRHAAIERKFAALAGRTGRAAPEHRFVTQAAAAHGVYMRAIVDVIELSQVDHSMSANAMSKAEQAFGVVAQRLSELARFEQDLSERASTRAAADFAALSVLMPLLVVLSVAATLGITMLVRRALLREVRGLSETAGALASGNLTVRKRSYGRDEIADTARTLDASIGTLNATLKSVLASARSIDSASRDIALGSAGMASRNAAQAKVLKHAASTVEGLGATAGRAADSASSANRLADEASAQVLCGGGVLDRLVLTMAAVRASSQRVAQIIGVIDNLACQTNALALNAAVEAAKAGEQGHGFATVAGEVRILAQRSANAAREIKELIAQALAEIDGGSAGASEAGMRMVGIAQSVQQVGDMVSRIGQASAGQAGGIGAVSDAIVQMDQMTRQNSVLVEEAAAAAQRLQCQALTLSKTVSGFRIDDSVPDAAGPPKKTTPHLRLASRRP
ncbi:methyl-accepting chemotaxis protein [Massilia sp. P8910]|uniref:methyl-accepting chemotaxis protein n=1 Tax=Massilia antarctica TaxID=2765360 RepID=UPI001E2EA773|nr:methyl-accepting chemotaxis protein [Massilia antarctica]MCE3602254.1 methyl-accepting chemotaxis protein [Massilia antarctica]